jgi:phosphoribosylcarboxyaminoimidazole (NCAIR) mutase
MPAGIPVATMAIGKAGARNAGIFAAQILSAGDPERARALDDFKKSLAAGVEVKADALKERLSRDGLA